MYCSDKADCAIERNVSFWDFKGKLETVDSWPLMSSPFPMLGITAAYLLFVLKIGPDHMKNRKPYSLQNVIVLYNIVQIFVSAYIVYLASVLSWPHGWVSKTCLLETEDTRDKPRLCSLYAVKMYNILVETLLTTIMYYYFLAKISEVLDTIFFVLRKKYNQVTFLHVYHHAIMIVNTWGILKYEPTYPTLFIRNINSFVHVIMYTYYALSSFPSLAKYLWWKKYITTLQLVQFTLILIHFTLTYVYSECTPSYPLLITIFWNTSFFLYLFAKFYLDTYKKKGLKKEKINLKEKEDEKKNSSTNLENLNVKDIVHRNINDENNVISRKKLLNSN